MTLDMQYSSGMPDLLNTPGIYYAIAYCIAALAFLRGLPQKLRGWKRWTFYAAVSVFLCFFMTVTKGLPPSVFLLTCLCDFLIVFLVFYVLADVSLREQIYFAVRAFMYGECIASVAWQMLLYGVGTLGYPLNIRTNLIFCLPVYAGLTVLAWFVEQRRAENGSEFELTRTALLNAFFLAVLIYAFSNLSFVYRNSPFSMRYTQEILLLRAFVDSFGATIFYLYDRLLRQMQAQKEVAVLQNMLKEQYTNYKVSRESVELINQKYHDLKHQIAILRAEGMSGQSMQRLDQMEADIRQYEAQNKTGNQVLDIILTSKSLMCQKHHIEMTVVADGTALSFMDAMDLSSLMGNALDNAIESVRQLSDYAQRLIHVTVVRKKMFACIEVENRYAGEIRMKNGMPQTTKGDSRYHGFGVKSMRQTVEKYGGSMTISAEDGWFHLSLLIPVPDSQKSEQAPLSGQ